MKRIDTTTAVVPPKGISKTNMLPLGAVRRGGQVSVSSAPLSKKLSLLKLDTLLITASVSLFGRYDDV